MGTIQLFHITRMRQILTIFNDEFIQKQIVVPRGAPTTDIRGDLSNQTKTAQNARDRPNGRVRAITRAYTKTPSEQIRPGRTFEWRPKAPAGPPPPRQLKQQKAVEEEAAVRLARLGRKAGGRAARPATASHPFLGTTGAGEGSRARY
jgi:hypothetical protein